MYSEALIRVAGLSKRFTIYEQPLDRLKQMFLPRVQRLLCFPQHNYYREFWALRDVSFEVHRGETVGIIGRNGSGKSTLLKLVCGTSVPSKGSVWTSGRVAALLELGAGFNPEFTGRENALLSGQILGQSPAEMKARLDDIIQFADIGEFINRPVKTYSSGMYVRLAFAVAIGVDPDILVVDEALSVGDAAYQAKCLARIRDMQRAGISILLVSHSPNTVIEFCDRALYMHEGQLIAAGPSREIIEQYSRDIVRGEGGTTATVNRQSASVATIVNANAGEMSSSRCIAPDHVSRKTEIVSIRLEDGAGCERGVFSVGNDVVVRFKVRVNDDNPRPCFGLQISSTEGIALWSVTTQTLKNNIRPLIAGEYVEFVWRLRLDVGPARYVLAVGVGDIALGEYRRHHRLEYAGHFDVVSEELAGQGWLGIKPAFEIGCGGVKEYAGPGFLENVG